MPAPLWGCWALSQASLKGPSRAHPVVSQRHLPGTNQAPAGPGFQHPRAQDFWCSHGFGPGSGNHPQGSSLQFGRIVLHFVLRIGRVGLFLVLEIVLLFVLQFARIVLLLVLKIEPPACCASVWLDCALLGARDCAPFCVEVWSDGVFSSWWLQDNTV